MKGRRTLLYLCIAVAVPTLLAGWLNGYAALWSFWRLPALTPHFADARNLTAGAESFALGYDPLYQSPQDPWQRAMNIPKVNQYILHLLHVDQHSTTAMGIAFIALFFVGIFLSFYDISHGTALMLALVIFSPAVMLGVERANYDLFMFFLIALALFLSRTAVVSAGLLLLAAVLKLFPIFAVPYFYKYPGKTQVACVAIVGVLFVTYVGLTHPDMQQVWAATYNTRGSDFLGYGSRALRNPTLAAYIPPLAIAFSAILLGCNAALARGRDDGEERYIDAFRAGAGIYIGTFFLGANWCYRLMFLIFTVPQLWSWRRNAGRRVVALTALLCIMVACWSPWRPPFLSAILLTAIDGSAKWVLLVCLSYLLASTISFMFVPPVPLPSPRADRAWD